MEENEILDEQTTFNTDDMSILYDEDGNIIEDENVVLDTDDIVLDDENVEEE